MQWLQTVSAVVFVTVVADTAADPAVSAQPAGDYVVEVRMEIPNVDAWSWKSTTRVCLPNAGAGNMPIPVLSPNNLFAGCRARNVERDWHPARLRHHVRRTRGGQGSCLLYRSA